MVEYVALMLGVMGLMFFMMELSFRLNNGAIIEGALFSLMDFIKVIVLVISFVLGLFAIWFMMLISLENTASTGLQNATTSLFYFWGVVIFVILLAFGIYYIWWVPAVISKTSKNESKSRRESGEE